MKSDTPTGADGQNNWLLVESSQFKVQIRALIWALQRCFYVLNSLFDSGTFESFSENTPLKLPTAPSLHFEPCIGLRWSRFRLSPNLHFHLLERGKEKQQSRGWGMVKRAAGSQIWCRLWPWGQTVGARRGRGRGTVWNVGAINSSCDSTAGNRTEG